MTTPPAAAPAFTSVPQCEDWLANTLPSNPAHAHTMLLRQMNLLSRYDLPGGEKLSILELLRPAVHDTQEDFGRRFSGKALPLAESEQAAFESCRALWHALATGYLRCVEASLAGDASVKSSAPLALQRALTALCDEQLETHRAGQMVAAEHWKLLHQTFATVEHCGALQNEISDPLRHGKTPTTPAAPYFEAILLQAGSLHELSMRHLGWVARWSRRWAAKLSVLDSPPTLSPRAIPLVIDLQSDKPAGYMPKTGDGVRWLDTGELRHSLSKRITLLEQGEQPAKLQLGNDCTQPVCEHLLKSCYQRWCKGGAIRRNERAPASGTCHFVVGVEAVHYYLSGRKPFKQPGSATMEMLRHEREEIATFGRIATHRDDNFSEQHGYQVENWQVLEDWHLVDESASGFRISRGIKQAGERVGHGQLVSMSLGSSSSYTLGCVRWSLVASADSLEAGIRLFPGAATPVALRPAAVTAAVNEKFRQGFLLPETPVLHEPRSVIVPVGTFKIDRVIEVITDATRQIRLTRLLDRGSDFERATFDPV